MPRNVKYGRLPTSSIQSFGISRQTFTDIERFIRENKDSQVKARQGIDLLVRTMCLVTKGLAQSKSAGPVAARRRSNPAMAHRIPVQRITGHYFAGWTQRHVGPGRWLLYNDSVEAWLIETGTYQRLRRPILKMSMIGMLRFLENTRTEQRFLAWVIAPKRDAGGRYAKVPFEARIQGTRSLGGMAGPSGVLP